MSNLRLLGIEISKKALFYILIGIVIVLDSVSVLAMKESLTNKNYIIVGVILNIIVILLFRQSLLDGSVGLAYALWGNGGLILISLGSIILLGERYTIYEYIGLFFAVLSTIFISISEFNIKSKIK